MFLRCLAILIVFTLGTGSSGFAAEKRSNITHAPDKTVIVANKVADSMTGKPLVVALVDLKINCAWDKQLALLIPDLERDYRKEVGFVVLDLARPDEVTLAAKKLGIAAFLSDAIPNEPELLVFDARRRLLNELIGPKQKPQYKLIIDRALNLHHGDKQSMSQ